MEYMIRYLKSSESFCFVAPDPLRPGETIKVSATDADVLNLIRKKFQDRPEGMDDDTYLSLRELSGSHVLSSRTLMLAIRQAHLRRIGRASSAWVKLRPKTRKPKSISPEREERLSYLREHESDIIANCVRHDWFDEYLRLRKDLDPHASRKSIIEDWRTLRAAELEATQQ